MHRHKRAVNAGTYDAMHGMHTYRGSLLLPEVTSVVACRVWPHMHARRAALQQCNIRCCAADMG